VAWPWNVTCNWSAGKVESSYTTKPSSYHDDENLIEWDKKIQSKGRQRIHYESRERDRTHTLAEFMRMARMRWSRRSAERSHVSGPSPESAHISAYFSTFRYGQSPSDVGVMRLPPHPYGLQRLLYLQFMLARLHPPPLYGLPPSFAYSSIATAKPKPSASSE
jgi:hypothetical protein